jgi:hypothetical protein
VVEIDAQIFDLEEVDCRIGLSNSSWLISAPVCRSDL